MIKFMRFKWLYFIISGIVIIPGIFSLLTYGLKPSIDFTGGSLIEYKFTKQLTVEEIKNPLNDKKIEYGSVQTSGENLFLIRTKQIDASAAASIKSILSASTKDTPQELRFETVGPVLGRELIIKTITAVLLAAGFILLYVARVFRNAKFGVCAILAMFHDSLVMLGVFSLLGRFLGVEVDTLFVTALLTVLSFSVHDTVVVYDRIRESQRKFPNTPFVDLVDKAITETLTRSFNNSLTIIFMLLALFLLGGITVKWFVFALLIGTVSGTYSSTFTAAPLLVVWDQFRRKK